MSAIGDRLDFFFCGVTFFFFVICRFERVCLTGVANSSSSSSSANSGSKSVAFFEFPAVRLLPGFTKESSSKICCGGLRSRLERRSFDSGSDLESASTALCVTFGFKPGGFSLNRKSSPISSVFEETLVCLSDTF